MGMLDDLLGKALPKGNISKPLILALLALLASGALTRKQAGDAPTPPAPSPAPTPQTDAGSNPLGDLLGGLLGGGGRPGGAPGAPGSNPLGDLLGGLLGGGGQPRSMAPGGGAGAGSANPLGDLLGGLLSGSANRGALAGGLAGGLGSLLEQFQQSGQRDVIDSWIGRGQNQQIAPQQLASAMDPEVIRQLARQFGMQEDEVLEHVSQGLPDVVDQMTPEGRVPGEDELSRLSRQLG
jgi:uncharacterized protein YidB (DUF937 family)